MPNFFDREKYVIHYENLQLYLRLGLKLKNIHRVLELNQSQWLKPYIELNTLKRIEAEQNNDKDGKALYKLMNNAIYGEKMKNLRNRIDVKLVNNEKDYLKCTSKPSYMSHKISDNNLVAIRKRKLGLKHSKIAYIGICILELSKVLMYEFQYDYIENEYDNMTKYYENSNKSVIGKMKDETRGVAIEEFVGLKPKMYSFLVDNSEHRNANGVNRNVVPRISHNEYKDVLLDNTYVRHSLNRIQSKGHTIGTYKINKISLFCFADKMYIQSNEYDGISLGYQT